MLRIFRSITCVLTLIAAIGLSPSAAQASFDGRADGATDCAPCHGGSATGSVGVSIAGSTTLAPGASDTYTFTIATAGAGGALNVAVGSTIGTATLGVTDANTQLLSGEITHLDAFSNAPAGNINDWSYSFTVTAPNNVGAVITLAAVGMQFDGDFDNSSADVWNIAQAFSISVPEPATGALMVGGLLGLAFLGRRSLRADGN